MSSAAPAGGGGKLSRSSSAIVAATERGYHALKIEGYPHTEETPTGECLESLQFTLCGHRWRIKYYPNGLRSDSADYISLYLLLDEIVPVGVKAKFMFSFADPVSVDKQPSLTFNCWHIFKASQPTWGYTKFIKRETLEKSKHLKDDSFTVRCDIIVMHEVRTVQTDDPKFVSVPPSDLNQHLGDLLKTEKGADVVFEVGGATFAAYRCVLAARSPVFSAELFGTMKEGDTGGVVRIDGMDAPVFKALLCFAYTDSLPETNKEEEDVMCQHLLVVADIYNMERLKLICEEKLCEYINVGTVATILALAEQHRCDGLKKACFDFLSSLANLRTVVASDGFDHLSRSCPSVMKELIAMLAP